MSNLIVRSFAPLFFGGFLAVLAACSATTAQAVMLVNLSIDATARPYGPKDPVMSLQQQFSVPGGEGKLIMTYTEDRYVGGPGGFNLDPIDLSNDHIGWGGSTVYTPHDPIKGQPYRVQQIWLTAYSKKMWVATLTAHHEYQAFQVRDRGKQIASSSATDHRVHSGNTNGREAEHSGRPSIEPKRQLELGRWRRHRGNTVGWDRPRLARQHDEMDCA